MVTLLLIGLLASPAHAWDIRGADGFRTGKTVDGQALLRPTDTWSASQVLTSPEDLKQAAQAALNYLDAHPDDAYAARPGLFQERGVTLDHVRATLKKVVELADANPRALQDGATLLEHFELLRWHPEAAPTTPSGYPADKIRLTKYVVWQVDGSPVRTAKHTHALYAVPLDEADLDGKRAQEQRDALSRYRYTRQQVLSGVYEAGGEAEGKAKPLVWLTEDGVHEAILQGTIEVRLPNGTSRFYNVSRNNGIAYDRSLKDHTLQGRYWYFQPVDGILGWGAGRPNQVRLVPAANVAGDIYNLGLGKIVAIVDDAQHVRLAVLADTGGAFQPNLHQLDFLAGTFPSRTAFNDAVKQMPKYAATYFLLARGTTD